MGREKVREVRDGLGDTKGVPKRVGGPSERSRKNRGTFG